MFSNSSYTAITIRFTLLNQSIRLFHSVKHFQIQTENVIGNFLSVFSRMPSSIYRTNCISVCVYLYLYALHIPSIDCTELHFCFVNQCSNVIFSDDVLFFRRLEKQFHVIKFDSMTKCRNKNYASTRFHGKLTKSMIRKRKSIFFAIATNC